MNITYLNERSRMRGPYLLIHEYELHKFQTLPFGLSRGLNFDFIFAHRLTYLTLSTKAFYIDEMILIFWDLFYMS